MKLSAREIELLIRAYKKPFVSYRDVAEIWNIPLKPKSLSTEQKYQLKERIKLRRLELEGFLEDIGGGKYRLSEKARKMMDKLKEENRDDY